MLRPRPRVVATVRRDGSGEVVFNGRRVPIEGRDVQDAGAIAVDLVAQRAADFHRPLRMTAQSPHDTRVLMVHADGRATEAKDSSLRPAHLAWGAGALAALSAVVWLWGLSPSDGRGEVAPAVAATSAPSAPAAPSQPTLSGAPSVPPSAQPAETPSAAPTPAVGVDAVAPSGVPATGKAEDQRSLPRGSTTPKTSKTPKESKPKPLPAPAPAGPAPGAVRPGGSSGALVLLWD